MLAPETQVALYTALDDAATEAQRIWRRRFVYSLVGLGLVAALTAGGGLVRQLVPAGEAQRAALVGLLLVGIGSLLYELRYAVRNRLRFRHWVRVRAVAEEVKSRAWRVALGAEAAPSPTPATDNWRPAAQQVQAGEPVPALAPFLATPGLLALRRELAAQPLPEQARYYRQHRLEEQHRYFTERLARLERRNRRHRRTELLLISAAIAWDVLLVLTIGTGHDQSWAGVYGVAGVLIAVIALHKAYAGAEKTDSLQLRYQDMLTELAARLAAPDPTTPEALHRWVLAAEHLLLTQTQEWQTQREA